MTNCNTGGPNSARLNSCKIARKSQGFSHVILLAIFVFCKWSMGMFPMLYGSDQVFRVGSIGSNLILRPLARKLNPITVGDESEKQYRISVICQADAEQEIRLLLINNNSCKTLYLNNLKSGDIVGDKVEIVAEYCSSGKPKSKFWRESLDRH